MKRQAAARLLLRIGFVLVLLIGGSAGNVLLVRGQNNLAILVVGGLLVTFVGLLTVERVMRRFSERSAPEDSLDRAADALGQAVRQQWEIAALERGLVFPVPVPVRWRLARSPVAGPASAAVGSEDVPARFAPLPGADSISVGGLGDGTLAELFEIYAGLDSGRLILVGGPGTGKTGAAVMLVVDALKHRDELRGHERRTTPVPVLLSCLTWDPRRQPFEAWVAEQLSVTYRFLRAPEYGADAAERLVAQGRIAVIADGFDETSLDVRAALLGSLNAQARCRIVLLSRDDELVQAARHEQLSGAAALELLPVVAQEAADYLERCRVHPAPESWQRLVRMVREASNPALVHALSKPLTLALVRDTIHADEDAYLLTQGDFADSEALEKFLLDRVIPTAYSAKPARPAPRYKREQAERWLRYIAQRMTADGIQDIEWWRFPVWQPSGFRSLANGLVAALVFAGVGLAAFGPRFSAIMAGAGLVGGIFVGIFFERSPDSRPVRLTPIRWHAFASSDSRGLSLLNMVGGVSYGTLTGLALAWESTLIGQPQFVM